MREHSEQILKGVCLLFAGLLAIQLIGLFRGNEIISELRVPDIQFAEPEEKPETTNPTPSQPPSSAGNPMPSGAPPQGMPAGLPAGISLPPGVTLPPGFSLPAGVSLPAGIRISAGGAMPVVSGRRAMSPAQQGPPLEPELQARVDVVLESGLFGAVPKPPPMALTGIAGKYAMLRGPGGQTGLIGIGEELGGMKLLEIGINRVLVEHEGEKKELMLFNGVGGESLLKN